MSVKRRRVIAAMLTAASALDIFIAVITGKAKENLVWICFLVIVCLLYLVMEVYEEQRTM